MPRRGGRHQVLVKGAEKAMEQFKLEVAYDLGLAHLIDEDGTYHQFTTVQVGTLGGEMVRRIQAAGEWAIKQRFEQGLPRLLPEEVLPKAGSVRNVSNNGNPTPHAIGDIVVPNTGQHWEPGNNQMAQTIALNQQIGRPPELPEQTQH